MPRPETHTRVGVITGILAVAVFGAAAIQVAFGWPMDARYIGPALLALSIHGALVLAFLAGDLWRAAAAADGSYHAARRIISIAAALTGWAGIWLGARDGLLMLAAGHLLLAIYWGAASRRGDSPFSSLVALFCAANSAALTLAALRGPFV